jgi:hypothetical protein
MVKYGYLMVGCINCERKLEDHSQIDIDREWEKDIISQVCPEWEINVDRRTRNTWTPSGKPDEIKYRVRIKCKQCGKKSSVKDGATSISNMEDNYKKECCGSTLVIHISTRPNGSSRDHCNIRDVINIATTF